MSIVITDEILSLLAEERARALSDASAACSRQHDVLMKRAQRYDDKAMAGHAADLAGQANGCDWCAHHIDQMRVK